MGEMSRGVQVGTIVGILGVLFGGGGSAVLWAADQRYTKKEDIAELATQVESNAKQAQAQARSVDALLIQILDMRIDELEAEISELEAEPDLTETEAAHLRDARKALNDARTERKTTFERILERDE